VEKTSNASQTANRNEIIAQTVTQHLRNRMKTKKIRGHKRIWTDIEKWKNANLKLDLENLKQKRKRLC
jgi:hypothetical protein